MAWYGWLGWGLMLLSVIIFLIYVIMIGKQPGDLAAIRMKCQQLEKKLIAAKAKAIQEAVARKKAERAKARYEMRILQEEHREQLAALQGKEKEAYEKAKVDPQSGVNYMRNVLGLSNGASEPRQNSSNQKRTDSAI